MILLAGEWSAGVWVIVPGCCGSVVAVTRVAVGLLGLEVFVQSRLYIAVRKPSVRPLCDSLLETSWVARSTHQLMARLIGDAGAASDPGAMGDRLLLTCLTASAWDVLTRMQVLHHSCRRHRSLTSVSNSSVEVELAASHSPAAESFVVEAKKFTDDVHVSRHNKHRSFLPYAAPTAHLPPLQPP